MIWGGAPAQHVIVATINTGIAGTVVTGNFPAPLAALATRIADRGGDIEILAGCRGQDGMTIEAVPMQRLDMGLFDETLAGRFCGLAVPAEFGETVACGRGTPAEIPVVRQSGRGAPVEALGAANISIASDAILPIEASSKQSIDRGLALEGVVSQRMQVDVPAGALAMLGREGAGPFEWLGDGTAVIADMAVELEWDRPPRAAVLSLETGPGRIRLLKTPGRARLLRRN